MNGFGEFYEGTPGAPILPPNTPEHLPHGNQRGGVLAAAWTPVTYMDKNRKTIPTNSPYTVDIQNGIFQERVPYSSPTVSKKITGPPPGVAGFGGMSAQFVNPRPVRVPGPRVPHGHEDVGIFGSRVVNSAAQVGTRVAYRLPMGGYSPGPGGVFGGSPDGLG